MSLNHADSIEYPTGGEGVPPPPGLPPIVGGTRRAFLVVLPPPITGASRALLHFVRSGLGGRACRPCPDRDHVTCVPWASAGRDPVRCDRGHVPSAHHETRPRWCGITSRVPPTGRSRPLAQSQGGASPQHLRLLALGPSARGEPMGGRAGTKNRSRGFRQHLSKAQKSVRILKQLYTGNKTIYVRLHEAYSPCHQKSEMLARMASPFQSKMIFLKQTFIPFARAALVGYVANSPTVDDSRVSESPTGPACLP